MSHRRIAFLSIAIVLAILALVYGGIRTMLQQHPAVAVRGPHGSYVTTFPNDEFPISEGGIWMGGRTVGLDWSDLGTVRGHSYGRVIGSGYDDPTALLSGSWGPDQMAR